MGALASSVQAVRRVVAVMFPPPTEDLDGYPDRPADEMHPPFDHPQNVAYIQHCRECVCCIDTTIQPPVLTSRQWRSKRRLI